MSHESPPELLARRNVDLGQKQMPQCVFYQTQLQLQWADTSHWSDSAHQGAHVRGDRVQATTERFVDEEEFPDRVFRKVQGDDMRSEASEALQYAERDRGCHPFTEGVINGILISSAWWALLILWLIL